MGESVYVRLRRFGGECVRVLKVTRKPDRTEYMTIVKVSGLGIMVVGLVGFIFSMVKQIFLS